MLASATLKLLLCVTSLLVAALLAVYYNCSLRKRIYIHVQINYLPLEQKDKNVCREGPMQLYGT